MRTIFSLCGLALIAGGFFAWKATQAPRLFGEFTGAPAIAVVDLVERPKDFLGKTISVEGAVSEQCQSMGCFFFFRAGAKTLRVELKEIAMKAPMREGRQARVEGQVVPFDGVYQLLANAVEFK